MGDFQRIKFRDPVLKRAWETAKWRLSAKSRKRVENEDLIRHLLGLDPELADLVPGKVRRAKA